MIKILLKNFDKIPEIKQKIINTPFPLDIYDLSDNLLRSKAIILYYLESEKDIEEIKSIYNSKNDDSILISLTKNINILNKAFDYIDDYIFLDSEFFFKTLRKKIKTILSLDKREKIEEEIASNIRKIILKEIPPYSSKLEIATEYIESDAIGGDFYDFQVMSNNYYGIFIADISGHGPSCALIAAMLKITFKSFGIDVNNPSWVIESINKTIYSSLFESGKFLTAFYAIFGNNKIEYSSAGHVNPILYRPKDDLLMELPVTNTLIIGGAKEFKYENNVVETQSGDIILLYTDGLLEAKNHQNNFFGKERINKIIKENSQKSVEEIKKIIYDEIMSFTGGVFEDDITFIVVKVK